MDFLKDELSGLPPSVSKAVLSELETIVRSARFSVVSEPIAADYALHCQRTCARIAATLQFASRVREQLAQKSKD